MLLTLRFALAVFTILALQIDTTYCDNFRGNAIEPNVLEMLDRSLEEPLRLDVATEAQQTAPMMDASLPDTLPSHTKEIQKWWMPMVDALLSSVIANETRRLSQQFDWFTGKPVQTYNGQVPIISCPVGTYHAKGTPSNLRQRQDGCIMCPRGRYGATTGLTDSSCTGPCPLGTYRDEPGGTSLLSCQLCPPNTYGTTTGLTTAACSATCPLGTYSDVPGQTSKAACITCSPQDRHPPCVWELTPRFGQIQDHLHNDFGLPAKVKDPLH